jgi:beta-glucosidase
VNVALASGEATMADVERHVYRYLRTLFAYGALDRDAFAPDEAAIDRAAHAREARRIAEAGITLLKNDGLLPLKRRGLDSVAVIGAAADEFITGGGSSEIRPYSFTSPLAGITATAGPGITVSGDDGTDAERAAELARGSDVAVIIATSYSTEGVDRTCLSLQCPPAFGDQDALIEAVAAANPRTVVVIQSGGPVLTPWRQRVGAVLEAWYPGSEGGSAIARVLFGKVDAQGRLPVSFPRSEADLPTAGDEAAYPGIDDVVTYDEGLLVGYRHYDANRIRPAFAFGHGRSYTRFRFSDLRIISRGTAVKRRNLARVSVAVTNTGKRRGVAVPQLYLGLPSHPGVAQPPKALKGFKRVALARDRTRRVNFRLDRRALSFWDAGADRWRLSRGCVRVFVGRSSRRTPLRGGIPLGGRCGDRPVRPAG